MGCGESENGIDDGNGSNDNELAVRSDANNTYNVSCKWSFVSLIREHHM